MLAVACDDYYTAGVAMAVSMVNEGPAPGFLSKELYKAIIGDADTVDIEISSLPDCTMKDDLLQVSYGIDVFVWSG